jgi:hypothetical protein
MNTPAHLAINLLVLARRLPPKAQLAVVAGALLPDLPMFWFYFYEKVVASKPESIIWEKAYFDSGWQNFFAVFNSAPLLLGAIALSSIRRARMWTLLFVSMLAHILLDFPLHREDAHRHVYPFTDWRFFSPVSYWDLHHYGNLVGLCRSARGRRLLHGALSQRGVGR